MDLLKASSLGSAACLDQKRTRYPILKECFTPRSTFYASVLESCILRPGHAREVSHSHNRIHREFSIMFQLTSMGKHDAITRDHSVQMKRHFLVQPQRYPFPKLACLPRSVLRRHGSSVHPHPPNSSRSVAGRRPRITVDATAKTQGTTTDIILLPLPVPPPFGQNLAQQLRLGNSIVGGGIPSLHQQQFQAQHSSRTPNVLHSRKHLLAHLQIWPKHDPAPACFFFCKAAMSLMIHYAVVVFWPFWQGRCSIVFARCMIHHYLGRTCPTD